MSLDSEPDTIVYTLPVVDTDGKITGKRGKVVVSSKPLVMVKDMSRIVVGEAILKDTIPSPGDTGLLLRDAGWNPEAVHVYTLTAVTDKPNPRGKLCKDESNCFEVWVRTH